MKPGLVNLAQGTPEQLSKLKIFIEKMKPLYPERRLKTLASGVELAVQLAERYEETKLTLDELKALVDTIARRELNDSESEEYDLLLAAAEEKLWKMITLQKVKI